MMPPRWIRRVTNSIRSRCTTVSEAPPGAAKRAAFGNWLIFHSDRTVADESDRRIPRGTRCGTIDPGVILHLQSASVMSGATPATVSLVEEDRIVTREHYTCWRRDRDSLGAPTTARDDA